MKHNPVQGGYKPS